MTDKELIAAFLAKGGKVNVVPTADADLTPQRPGQWRALREKRGMQTNWSPNR